MCDACNAENEELFEMAHRKQDMCEYSTCEYNRAIHGDKLAERRDGNEAELLHVC
jgi:hypothetical protein